MFCILISVQPARWRLQFVSHSRGWKKRGKKQLSRFFRSPSDQLARPRTKRVHMRSFSHTVNVDPRLFCKHLERRQISPVPQSPTGVRFSYPDNLCTCNNSVQWNLRIHKACHWKAQLPMNADWWSPGCCNKTWASGPNFYFEIIKIASFFSGVTMVILSCSNAILI